MFLITNTCVVFQYETQTIPFGPIHYKILMLKLI